MTQLPRSIVIGPMKAGTTWIHEYLSLRGDVCLPDGVKETFYFDRYYNRGDEWYSSHFQHFRSTNYAHIIEIAPSLFHHKEAPSRIATTLGMVPIIITTRDPIKRAWSHYVHLKRKGYTRAPLVDATRAFPEILEASRYERHISRWKAALPGSLFTTLALEELALDQDRYAAKLCAAIGLVPRKPPSDMGTSNASGTPYSYHLARIGRQAAETIRSAGGYSLVNAAKRIGLKSIFFGADGSNNLKISPDDKAFLRFSLHIENDSWIDTE